MTTLTTEDERILADAIIGDAQANAQARDLARAREQARRSQGNGDLNARFRAQKAALTRAIKSGSSAKVVLTVQAAVKEWDRDFPAWPDDWSRWQRALDDVLPWNARVDINDL